MNPNQLRRHAARSFENLSEEDQLLEIEEFKEAAAEVNDLCDAIEEDIGFKVPIRLAPSRRREKPRQRAPEVIYRRPRST